MKNLSFILSVLFYSSTTFAQGNDTINAVITYAFSHLRNAKADKPYTENMDLFLSRNSSWYVTGDKAKDDSIMEANFIASGKKIITAIIYSNEQMFLNFDDHKFFIKNRLTGTNYLMEDSWPTMNWKITNETSTISTLKCQKAVGGWRGRTYTVWFCNDLPYHAGPWKLNGLPGLIIEAHDEKNEVVFKFAGFRTIKNGKDVIKLPANVVKTTVKDYDQMYAAFKRDAGGFINNAYGKQVIQGTNTAPTKPATGNNNPVELTDK